MQLYSEELDYEISKDFPNSFLGVFSIDNFPQHVNLPWYSYIVNTDPSYRQGMHWMAVCKPPDTSNILFLEPLALLLHKILNSGKLFNSPAMDALKIKTLPFAIQSFQSRACGQFCAYMLCHLPSYYYNLDRMICLEFDDVDLKFNENKVVNWFIKRQHSHEKAS